MISRPGHLAKIYWAPATCQSLSARDTKANLTHSLPQASVKRSHCSPSSDHVGSALYRGRRGVVTWKCPKLSVGSDFLPSLPSSNQVSRPLLRGIFINLEVAQCESMRFGRWKALIWVQIWFWMLNRPLFILSCSSCAQLDDFPKSRVWGKGLCAGFIFWEVSSYYRSKRLGRMKQGRRESQARGARCYA